MASIKLKNARTSERLNVGQMKDIQRAPQLRRVSLGKFTSKLELQFSKDPCASSNM